MPDNAVGHSRVSGVARLLRGWFIAVVAVLLAVGGHQAAHTITHGSAEAIPAELLVFSAALTAPIAVLLAGRRVAQWSTAVTTVVGQIVFHLLYSMASPSGHSSHGAHHHHGHHDVTAGSQPHTSEALAAGIPAEVVMVAAHLLAAALTTTVIIYGERSLLAIVAWLTLAPSRFVLATPSLRIDRPKTAQPMYSVWIPHPMDVSQTRSTRGPPILA